jgi:hypothetical protein
MPLPNTDFVNGDSLEFPQFRMGKVLPEIPLLNILDDIPAHPKMTGHILDGHMPQQFPGISLIALRIASSILSEPKPNLANHTARHTPAPLHGQQEPNWFQAYGRTPEKPLHMSTTDRIRRTTAKASQFVATFANLENDSTALIISTNMLIASKAKSVVQKTRGHAWVPPLIIST